MCGYRIHVIGHYSAKIGALMNVLTRPRDGDAIEGDVTLTDKGLEEITGHARDAHKVHILSLGQDQITLNVELDI